ncbi:MAG: CDP-diacylglycerol--glycerol-3-phosphate 3-phosphatidyltransferase [Candidatus Eisenbacteria bacterium]|nr:CDP-diacylglycerol--glycerol-3-phosphate 3-phosphatidyltransferase [Candidatus Eisenbacteria bacterium]
MNLPNLLTLSRILLSPVFMTLFLINNVYSRYIAFLVFLVAALTDLVDGWLARRAGVVTGFGKFMDPLADKILTSTALITLLTVRLPFVYGWMVMVMVGREILITGLRTVAAYRGLMIPPSQAAKAKTMFQMGFVILSILHVLAGMTRERFGTPLFWIGGPWMETVLAVILAATTALTLLTGLHYLLANRAFIRRVLR